MWEYGLDRVGSGYVQVEGTWECCKEHSGSIKCEEFLDYLKTGSLLKKDTAPRISMYWLTMLDNFSFSQIIKTYSTLAL